MQDLHLKDLMYKVKVTATASGAEGKAEYRSNIPLSDSLLFRFLNISVKKFYTAMYQEQLKTQSPVSASGYKKIYSYFTANVPGVADMTIGQFLRYVYLTYFEPFDFADIMEEQQKKQTGNKLAELFFVDTFNPLLKRAGVTYETTLAKLEYTQKN